MKKHAIALFAFIAPALAFADIPPPPGYVETCTVERQCKKGEESDVCRAYYGDPQACEKKHAGDDFEQRCRTSGASVWSEVWCRPAGKKKAAEVVAPKGPAQPVEAKPVEAKPAEVKPAEVKPADAAKAGKKKHKKHDKTPPAKAAP